MGDRSNIEWTDATWNPVHGCSKVSPGCAHCYAETLSRRFRHTPAPWTPANAAANVQLKPERLDQPLRWRRPRMVFVNSMSDLFHEQVPDHYIARVFAVMAAAPQHTFQVLTKRPERMRALLTSRAFWDAADIAFGDLGTVPIVPALPLPNVWLGVSIENRRFVGRADTLRATPTAVRFISAEPLLGPLVRDGLEWDSPRDRAHGLPPRRVWMDGKDEPELDLHRIDWLIAGGESGPRHREMREEWARDLRDACDAAGTAFFLKQWGGARPGGPALLDGREHRDMPTAPTTA